MVSKGQFVGLDWNRIPRDAVPVKTHKLAIAHHRVSSVTGTASRGMRFQSRPTNWPLLTIESPVAQWLEHPTRSRRVVGSNPIWDSEFFSESNFS